MTLRPRRLLALCLFGTIAVLIAFATLTPPTPPTGASSNDKLYHFAAFALLVLPVSLLWRPDLARACLVAAGYGAVIEVIQPWFGRSGEWADLAANLAGIVAAAGFGLLVMRLRPLARHGSARINRM